MAVEDLQARIDGPQAVVRRVSDIPAEKLEWLVLKMFPSGKFGMIAGDPGLGKSVLVSDLAAAVTAGARHPWVAARRGEVLLLNAEDDIADTVRPRLESAGARIELVHVLEAVREPPDKKTGKVTQRSFNLAKDCDRLREVLIGRTNIRLVVIDPITAYMGGVDSHKNTDVRDVLKPLSDLASKYRVTVIGVSHLNKGGSGANALYRVMGSLAFVAAARFTFGVIRPAKEQDEDGGWIEPDPNLRLFVPLKQNLAPSNSPTFAFRVIDNGEGIPKLEWETDAVQGVDVERALGGDSGGSSAKKERDAAVEDWLRERLEKGPQPAADMWQDAEHRKFSSNRVKAAQKRLGVRTTKEKREDGRAPWFWSLPGKKTTADTSGPVGALASLGALGSTQEDQPDQEAQEDEGDQGDHSLSRGNASDEGGWL